MADPTGSLFDFFKFSGEPKAGQPVGKTTSPQFSRFFEEIDRLQGLGVDELTNRNLRASLPEIDRGFNQGASRLSESLGGRGLQFGGIARGANQGLANLLGVSRGQASLDSLLQAEEQRKSGIQQALNLFAGLFGIRTGQANINLGFGGLGEQRKAGVASRSQGAFESGARVLEGIGSVIGGFKGK